MMAINQEDGTLEQMSQTLKINKSNTIVLALSLLNYTLEQRKVGQHLTFAKEGKTKDILNEACAGNLAFKLND